MINQCVLCQANGPENRPDHLQVSPLPPEPWRTVHMNFCGSFPTREYLFVVIDAYSRYPEVEIVHSTAARSTIPKMNRIFATHGIPRIVKSDNCQPFTSKEIKGYMEKGIKHSPITPLLLQVNSEADNFMKLVTKAIRAAHVEGRLAKRSSSIFVKYQATLTVQLVLLHLNCCSMERAGRNFPRSH